MSTLSALFFNSDLLRQISKFSNIFLHKENKKKTNNYKIKKFFNINFPTQSLDYLK
jgi:hypothetical protein